MDCAAIRGRIGRIRGVQRSRTAAFTAQMDNDECTKRKDGCETSDAEYAHNRDSVFSREWIVVEAKQKELVGERTDAAVRRLDQREP